ncbi:HEAT repeat domain-containing protein [Stieleria maiorica]|nr:HEAT repeat domain-containing protein [Stieleria maiorica]
MDDDELERTPNPFSAFAESRNQTRRHFASTAKYLIGAFVLFGIVTAGQVYLQRARLAEIISGFSQLSTAEKLDQLQRLQASGVDGIPGIVAAVVDEKPEVSARSAELLQDLSRQWVTLPADQLAQRRFIFADQLAAVSGKLTDFRDPRWIHVQDLARLAARDLIDSGCAENDATYRRLMQVIAIEIAPPLNPSAQDALAQEKSATDMSAGETTAAGSSRDSIAAADQPLPIDLADNAAAGWTDWPPTSTTPTLYRRTVATLDPMDRSEVMLQQAAESNATAIPEARLLKPRFKPAATLVDQSKQRLTNDTESTSYWITQLGSPSPFVRKGAVTELGKRGDAASLAALRGHFQRETDPKIRQLINSHLER